jgi:hypothetical protein
MFVVVLVLAVLGSAPVWLSAPPAAADGVQERDVQAVLHGFAQLELEFKIFRRNIREVADLLSDVRLILVLLLIVTGVHLAVVLRRPQNGVDTIHALPLTADHTLPLTADHTLPLTADRSGAQAVGSGDEPGIVVGSESAGPSTTSLSPFARWALIQAVVFGVLIVLFALFVLLT